MKTAPAALLLIMAAACSVPCPASDRDYRPRVANHAAAFLWFLNPLHQPASTLEKGAWEMAPFFHYSSHYVGVDATPWQLFQHTEIATLFLTARHGAGKRITLDAEIPLHAALENRVRGLGHRYQIRGRRYWLLADGETVFDGSTGAAAGDATLGATFLLVEGGGARPRLSLRAAFEMPTGDDARGFGNGRLDASAVLAAKWRSRTNPRKGFEARFFGVEPGGLGRAPSFPARFYYGGDAAFHLPVFRPWGKRWTAGGLVFWNTSPVGPGVEIEVLRSRSFGLAGAFFYDASPRWQWEFMFMEDFTDAALAQQDFAFGLGMRRRI